MQEAVQYRSLDPMPVTYGPFSREAAPDRSPWVERSETLGSEPLNTKPRKGRRQTNA